MLLVIGLLPMDAAQAQKKKTEDVAAAASKTGRVDPKEARTSSKKTSDLLVEAFELSYAEDYDGALAKIAELEVQPKINSYERAKALQMRSQIAADRDQMREAASYLEQAVELDILPNVEHFQAMMIISQIYAQEENYETSNYWFNRWEADANVVTGSHWAMLAQNYYYMDDFEKAVEIMDKAFATGEEPLPAWSQLKANSLYELERFEDAASFAREQKLRFVDDPKLRGQFLGMEAGAYVEADNYPQALAVLEDAKSKGWLDRDVQWRQLYQLYFESEQYAKAGAALEEAMGNGMLPKDARTYSDLGDALYLQDKATEAMNAFTQAAALSDEGHADLQRGHILLDQEKDGEAEIAIRTALDKGKLRQEGNAWYLLCLAQYNQNKTSAAAESCRKGLTFDESRANSQQLLKMMGRS
jgi:tetratricopeptide (TPR) repeat protein